MAYNLPLTNHHKTVLLETRVLSMELRKSTTPIKKGGLFYKESKAGLPEHKTISIKNPTLSIKMLTRWVCKGCYYSTFVTWPHTKTRLIRSVSNFICELAGTTYSYYYSNFGVQCLLCIQIYRNCLLDQETAIRLESLGIFIGVQRRNPFECLQTDSGHFLSKLVCTKKNLSTLINFSNWWRMSRLTTIVTAMLFFCNFYFYCEDLFLVCHTQTGCLIILNMNRCLISARLSHSTWRTQASWDDLVQTGVELSPLPIAWSHNCKRIVKDWLKWIGFWMMAIRWWIGRRGSKGK
jgi:hypothetical protein